MSITPVRMASLLIPPLTVMAVIFYLSAQPGAGDYAAWEVALRKLGHVTGYALLALAWWRAFRGLVTSSDRVAGLLAAAASLAYAASDEVHQTFISGRHGSPVDVLVDSAGIALALILAVGLPRRRDALRRQET